MSSSDLVSDQMMLMKIVIFTFNLLLQSALGQIVARAPAKCVTQSGTDCIFPFIYKEWLIVNYLIIVITD